MDREALKETLKSVLVEIEAEKNQTNAQKSKVVVPKLKLGDNISNNSRNIFQFKPETVLSTNCALRQDFRKFPDVGL